MLESRALLLLSVRKRSLSKNKAKTVFTYDVVCLTRGRKSSMTCFQPEYKTKLFATEVVMLFKSIIYFSMLAKKAPLGPASLCPSALVLYLTQSLL